MIYTLFFGDYEFPNQTFEVVGLPIDNDIREDTILRRHGTLAQDPYLKSRRIKIKGTLHGDDADTVYSDLMSMQEALLSDEAAFKYRSDRSINCFTRKFDPTFEIGTDKRVIRISIDLLAQSPFFSSTGASYSESVAASGGTYNFDVYNGGNVFSEPIIYICATGGTINDDIKLINQTDSDKFIRYRGILANGQTLRIDSSILTVVNNEVAGLTYFEGDFLSLLAGTNSFQFEGDDCQISVEYKYRWF